MNKTCPQCKGDKLSWNNLKSSCYYSLDSLDHVGMHAHFHCLNPECRHEWVESGNYYEPDNENI
jgi:hypothetical protein